MPHERLACAGCGYPLQTGEHALGCPIAHPEGRTDREIMSPEQIVAQLKQLLDRSGFAEEFQGEEAVARKEKLERIAEKLPRIADLLLEKFRALTQVEGLDPGVLTLFLVGGRIRATPIKENTDFDVVITAENRLSPYEVRAGATGRLSHQVDKATISLPQRHAIAKALYEEVPRIFAEVGSEDDYEKGILEIKGFGERSAEILLAEEGVMKIAENR